MNPSSRCANADTIACDNAYVDAGLNLPAISRRRTASVSRRASSGSTAGFRGPCTVTTYLSLMI